MVNKFPRSKRHAERGLEHDSRVELALGDS
jgi:hypothetical protein